MIDRLRREKMKRDRDRNKEERLAGQVVETTFSADAITSSGITFHVWRLYQHAWLICLLFPLAQVVRNPTAPGHIVARGLALAGFAAGYTWVMWPHPASAQARGQARIHLAMLILVVLFLLVLILSLIYGPAWLWLFLGVSAMAGVLLPLRSAFATVVLLTLLPLVLTFLTQSPGSVDLWWLLAFLLLVRAVGLDMIGVARMGSAIRELHTARQAIARLKVEEERQRLARDLHDLLGQTLSVITLKSELARSLITEDPERCAQELAEVEQVGRMTLREVRRTVAGYRQPRLAHELEGACQVLEAAGISPTIEQATGELPPKLDAVLAWTLREGITNVIRHSRARRCLVRLSQEQDTIQLEILNDRGLTDETAGHLCTQGSGLCGLRERVGVLGGAMEATPLSIAGTAHFRLRVEVPLQACADAVACWEERS
jgi:two-component system sensor histidine kinase DesK